MDKRKALGRGLSALIPNLQRPSAPQVVQRPVEEPAQSAEPAEPAEVPASEPPAPVRAPVVPVVEPPPPARREFFLCPIEEIRPSADNPRHLFDEKRLQELADSIRTQGLVQPLVVRLRNPEEMAGGPGPSFELIAGERRWRAAQRAGLKDVPVVVKDVNASRAFELALVENLQREDLNAIEEAEAYRRLSDEFGYTQEQLAERVGRDRTTVTNSLRLLKLPAGVQRMVQMSELSAGHARALLGVEDEARLESLARRVTEKQLSVRQTEQLVKKEKRGEEEEIEVTPPDSKTPAVRHLEDELQKTLGTRVRLLMKDKKAGKIEIDFNSLDELDRLTAILRPRALD